MTIAAPRPARRPAAAAFILATVAIDAMGIGLIMPVMPQLLEDIGGIPLDAAAVWGGWLAFSYAAMQFLFGPALGALSDRFGRRPVLLASLAALAADYVILALAPSLWLLFVARVLSGIAGATNSIAYAYVADVTPVERRAAQFGLIGAAFGVGFVIGPAIGGLLGELGPRAPFVAAAILAGANLLYGAVALPESLPRDRRRAFAARRADPFRALRNAARLPGLGPLLAVIFIYNVAIHAYPAVWSFYTIESFGWSVGEVGLSLAAYGAIAALTQGVAIGPIIARLGERRTTLLGLAADVIGAAGIAFASSGWMVYALMPLLGLSALVTPALTAMMSRIAAEDSQGELQGVIAGLAGISAIVSPVLMTTVFDMFVGADAPLVFPGAPFLLSAALAACAAALFAVSRPTARG